MNNNQNKLIIHSQDILNELEIDWFEERAAIFEFEAGLTRQEAEQRAWEELQCLRGKNVIHKAG